MTAIRYSYSMRRESPVVVRELELSCPLCHGGELAVEVAEDRKTVLSVQHFGCEPSCSYLRYQGAADAEIANAIAEANRRESDGADSSYADVPDAAERQHYAAQAQRLK